ncbi:unnamed protein product [Adineta ricciae]|uniref:Uncharacterized protein n=1 Tax=Adineta ricciae TaxID=249248 RepID=A0A813Q804_ADIRI|nr:unnamed protein product [Adineta ricciae]
MATTSQNRAFQAYNSRYFPNRPAPKESANSSSPKTTTTPATPSTAEPLVFGRIPYSSIKSTTDKCSSIPSSPVPHAAMKTTPMTEKRCSSITSLSHLLPRQKTSQMTTLASQRQSLWISIAKNAQLNANQQSSLPLLQQQQQQTSLTRKKFLRLLLVFSYLLSISLFAIALATFYGFFWTDYSTTQISNVDAPVSAFLSPPNSTIINRKLPADHVNSNHQAFMFTSNSFHFSMSHRIQ